LERFIATGTHNSEPLNNLERRCLASAVKREAEEDLGQREMALMGVQALVPREDTLLPGCHHEMFFSSSRRPLFLMLILLVKIFIGRINKAKALSISGRRPAMLQNLSKDIRECYLQAEQCRRWAEIAPTQSEKADFLDMERRWLSLAHSYEFAEWLSDFSLRMRKQRRVLHAASKR
jgi:hypothetical protein